MPNRIIKESIRTSETVASLTDFEFRLWIELIVSADDAGRGDARAAIIKGSCFPLRDRVTAKDIDAALHGLAAKGCVSLYTVGGKPYFWFPSWAEHQRIRDCKPKYPDPADADAPQTLAADCGNSPQVAADCGLARAPAESESESNTNPNPNTRVSTRFAPPSREEAEEYCREKSINVNLDAWFAYYEQNGWMVGRQKMKDWQASLRYWATKERRPTMVKPGQTFAEDPDQEARKMERLRKLTAAMG